MTEKFREILHKRLTRRRFLQGSGVLALCAGLPMFSGAAPATGIQSSLTFTETSHELTPQLEVPSGYQSQVLLKWGEPLFAGGPAFDPLKQSAEKQQQQFGYNNDFIGFLSLISSKVP